MSEVKKDFEKTDFKCSKCGKTADYWIITGYNAFGNKIKESWCNDCIEKRKKEEKEKNTHRCHIKRPDE